MACPVPTSKLEGAVCLLASIPGGGTRTRVPERKAGPTMSLETVRMVHSCLGLNSGSWICSLGRYLARPCWPWAGLKGMGSRRAGGFSTGKAKVLSYGFSSSSHRLLRATAHREGTKSMFAMLQPRSSLILAHPRLCDGPAKYCGRASFRTARQ